MIVGRFYFLAMTAVATAFVSGAKATETWCAVTKQTNDGFVSVRAKPTPSSPLLGRLGPTDFLYVGTEQCRDDFGHSVCSRDGLWVFVEEVRSLRSVQLKGWVNSRLIRQIACPDE